MEIAPAERPGPMLSIIAPCFNEADNLRELVARCLRVLDDNEIPGELILVDDGSRDGTGEVMREQATTFAPRVRVLAHRENLGIEASWRSGLGASRGVYACFLDADLQNQPEDITRLFREIRASNADIVQGVRRHIGAGDGGRALMSVGLNWLLNLSFGMRARDSKSGFVLARREVLDDILSHRHRYRYFQTFISVAAATRGYCIREVETLFERRIHGQSFLGRFPLKVIFLCLVDLAKAIHEFRFRRHRDLLLEELLDCRLPTSIPPPVTRGLRKAWLALYLRLMPLHHWMITRDAGYHYQLLDRSQWLATDALEELQGAKLRRLVAHAYWHVPYYRRVMDERGIGPLDVCRIEDLRRLPLLSKEIVRQRFYSDLMSDHHDKKAVLRISTSGSTGEPLSCWVDRRQLELRWAATLRGLEWAGYRFGDRSVRLWHQNIGMKRTQVWKEKLDSRLCRRKLVPAFEFDPARVKLMQDVIRRHRPRLVEGYAESFHYLSRARLDPDLQALGIEGIVSSAQTLDADSRESIAEAFGARVFDKYGSREFSGISYECSSGGRHIVAESYVVEILVEGRPARPGELGEVVITDLNNFVMPFVRYQIGDLAYAVDNREPCPCGRGLPRMGAIEGRVQSMVLGVNGRAVPSSFFFHLLKDYGYAVSRFQIEQTAPGTLVFRYVPADRFHPRVLKELAAAMRRYLGEEMEILLQPVDRIEMVRTGKYRAVVNQVPLSYQAMNDVLDPRSFADS
jgi:phenylacetate-CoA ligase